MMKPDDPSNIQKISDGHSPAYALTDANTFVNGKVNVVGEEETRTYDYAALVMNTSVKMENLTVVDIYTTTAEDSSSKGAMTLTCESPDGTVVTVRTAVLRDGAGELITEDAYSGKTIDVRGIVDYFDGEYQIKVLTANDITIIK
jgi:DNA/RNA endonuclease YhcR with UshA esterase domain